MAPNAYRSIGSTDRPNAYGSIGAASPPLLSGRPRRCRRQLLIGTVAALALGFCVCMSLTNESGRSGIDDAATTPANLEETVAVEFGDCECASGSCDQKDADRGTWCVVKDSDCIGSDGYQSLKDAATGDYWAACSVIYGFNQCQDKPCANGGFCVDGHNTFECLCQKGFEGLKCGVETDACLVEGNECSGNANCVDLPPPGLADAAGRKCVCNDGYQGDGITCLNADACEASKCHGFATCTDLPPPALGNDSGRICECNDGYTGDGIECTEIDGCESSPCDANAVCTDKAPPAGGGVEGRQCVCPPGYDGNGEHCKEIDACLTNSCPPTARCSDLLPPAGGGPDGRKCICQPGYEHVGNSCIEANACRHNPCGLHEHCTDLPAPAGIGPEGRVCECESGYKAKAGGDHGCVEIDGCASNPCDVEAKCVDSPPPSNGFACHCPAGFDGDGTYCNEVDACDTPARIMMRTVPIFKETEPTAKALFKALHAAPHKLAGYGYVELQALSQIKNRDYFGAAKNLGWLFTIRFTLDKDSKMSFRFGANAAWGGAVMIDGKLFAEDFTPLAFHGDWSSKTDTILTVRGVHLAAGNHVMIVGAADDLGDEGMTFEFRDDVAWMTGERDKKKKAVAAAANVPAPVPELDLDVDISATDASADADAAIATGTDVAAADADADAATVTGTDVAAADADADATTVGDTAAADSAGIADEGDAAAALAPASSTSILSTAPAIQSRIMSAPFVRRRRLLQSPPAGAGGGASYNSDAGAVLASDDGFQAMTTEALQGLGNSPCNSDATCSDLAPPLDYDGYKCACNDGFTGDGVLCRETDACRLSPCDVNAKCSDLPAPALGDSTGRVCECATGYEEAGPTGERCDEINACLVSPCHPDAECTDLGPPHEGDASGRLCECKHGYAGNGETCVEDDACTNWPCAVDATCTDAPPPALDNAHGRECACNDGFYGDGETCEDADACELTPCSRDADCVDMTAPAPAGREGRTCTCREGFAGDGETCSDIDACANAPCAENSVCVDLRPPAGAGPDGRRCHCAPGYIALGRDKTCVQIDACKDFPCASPDATCQDLPPPAKNGFGGRVCKCKDGFDGDGTECQDIDACRLSPCGDHAVCQDFGPPAGGGKLGRSCTCESGYRGDGDTCVPIDACNSNPCDHNAECHDEPAPESDRGFRCTCNTGFEGDGLACVEINGCVTMPCNAAAKCEDVPAPALGDEHGRTCTCNEGYQGDGVTCEDVDACAASLADQAESEVEVIPCDVKAKCIDLPPPADGLTGFKCECRVGYKGDGTVCLDRNDCKVWYDYTQDASAARGCTDICMDRGAECTFVTDSFGKRSHCFIPQDSGTCYCLGRNSPGAIAVKSGGTFATPCMHGKCADKGPNARECVCDDGWTGAECDEQASIDDCPAGICGSHGTCIDLGEQIACRCEEGYAGPKCGGIAVGGRAGGVVLPLGAHTHQSAAMQALLAANSAAHAAVVGTVPGPSKIQYGGVAKPLVGVHISGSGSGANPRFGAVPGAALGPTAWAAGTAHPTGLVQAHSLEQSPKKTLEPTVTSGPESHPSTGPLYEVTIWGGAADLDGTLDAVSVRFTGSKGDTGYIPAFPTGVPAGGVVTRKLYALDVGDVTKVRYSQTSATDTFRPAGIVVGVHRKDEDGDDEVTTYAAASGAPAGSTDASFAEVTAGKGVTKSVPMFDYTAACKTKYSTECDAVPLVAAAGSTATLTASSTKSSKHGAERAILNADGHGWAPGKRTDGEWVEVAFPTTQWASQLRVRAGKTDHKLCKEGASEKGTWLLQPPLCCEYAGEFQLLVKNGEGDGGWYHVGLYAGRCDGDTVVNLEPSVKGTHFRLVVLAAHKVKWPALQFELYGNGLYGPAMVGAAGPLDAGKLAKACSCWAQQGPSGFAEHGACTDDEYVVCPIPSGNDGCFLEVKKCNEWGYGFMNGRDVWGEHHLDRSGFSAIGYTGINEEACLRRSQELYTMCKNTGDSPEDIVKATFLPTGGYRVFPGAVRVVEATYGASCRYDIKTTGATGAMSCDDYCDKAINDEAPIKSNCVAAFDKLNKKWIDCNFIRGVAPAKVDCYCRGPTSAGTLGVRSGNVDDQVRKACDGRGACAFDAMVLGDKDGTKCEEDLDVRYRCDWSTSAISRSVHVRATHKYHVDTGARCVRRHDTRQLTKGWPTSESFNVGSLSECQARCSKDKDCLSISYWDNALADNNCLPTLKQSWKVQEGEICTLKNVPNCDPTGLNPRTTNCNTWGLELDECRQKCAKLADCVAVSYTAVSWNQEHNPGCVVWDHTFGDRCAKPEKQASWNTYFKVSGTLEGCYRSAKVLNIPIEDGELLSWAECHVAVLKKGYKFFGIVDSKDGMTGNCMAGTTVDPGAQTDEYKCMKGCSKDCLTDDGSTMDSDGHLLGGITYSGVYAAVVYAEPKSAATDMSVADLSKWSCLAKNPQVAIMDCSKDLNQNEKATEANENAAKKKAQVEAKVLAQEEAALTAGGGSGGNAAADAHAARR